MPVSVTLVRLLVSLALVSDTVGANVVVVKLEPWFRFAIGQSLCASAFVSDHCDNICVNVAALPVWVTLVENV